MTFEDLFDRAEAHGVTTEGIRSALAVRRAERSDRE